MSRADEAPTDPAAIFAEPSCEHWDALLARNLDWAATLPGELASIRARARADIRSHASDRARQSASLADAYESGAARDQTEWYGAASATASPIVVTGHQPDFWHPGIRVKVLLGTALARRFEGLSLDVVVDTDDVGRLGFRIPFADRGVDQRELVLVEQPPGVPYMAAAPPSAERRAGFRAAGLEALESLPDDTAAVGFRRFCDALDELGPHAQDVGSLMTAIRHMIDPSSAAGVTVRLSQQTRSEAFRMFAALVLADAPRFATAYNQALAAYRTASGTRSAAQPVPDLATGDRRTEVPFWVLVGGKRTVASVEGGVLYAGDEPVCRVATRDEACNALASADVLLAPKALTLTMFERLCVADLFIHGMGGGRYDAVTDSIIRAYFGVEPPAFVVASMTARAPLGLLAPSGPSVADVDQQLHRLKHNPDSFANSAGVPADELRALATEKQGLVAAIGQPDADRKVLGVRIKELNTLMGRLLDPVAERLTAERAEAELRERAIAVITDRTYPYFMHDLDTLDGALA